MNPTKILANFEEVVETVVEKKLCEPFGKSI